LIKILVPMIAAVTFSSFSRRSWKFCFTKLKIYFWKFSVVDDAQIF
jgi:hypothetical protein